MRLVACEDLKPSRFNRQAPSFNPLAANGPCRSLACPAASEQGGFTVLAPRPTGSAAASTG